MKIKESMKNSTIFRRVHSESVRITGATLIFLKDQMENSLVGGL
jgi:hypothetical protein